MRYFIASPFEALSRWVRGKAIPPVLAGPQWSGPLALDAYRRQRPPSANELLAELKNTAWSCASLNAAVCANHPPQLYVATSPGQPSPKCLTKPISSKRSEAIRACKSLSVQQRASHLEQVIEHPLLDLLLKVNPYHNAFDLWELTTLYQEVHGSSYWYLDRDSLGIPRTIWILPSHNVTPVRRPDSAQPVDAYVYRTLGQEQRFLPEEIIHFRYPDPRDPYTSGLAPLRACFEQVSLTSDYAAMRRAIYENRGLPGAIVSPEEVVGEEERARLEAQWNQKFRRGGAGRVLIAESKLKVDVLQTSMGDLAQLAEIRATMEDICNAFHVPIAYMSTNTNLANLQAAERQHLSNAIHPRLKRRDEKLNEQLVSLFDPTGRLFLASEDPTPVDLDADFRKFALMMKYGINTINEVRETMGLPAVPWGDAPWLPTNWSQVPQPAPQPDANVIDDPND